MYTLSEISYQYYLLNSDLYSI